MPVQLSQSPQYILCYIFLFLKTLPVTPFLVLNPHTFLTLILTLKWPWSLRFWHLQSANIRLSRCEKSLLQADNAAKTVTRNFVLYTEMIIVSLLLQRLTWIVFYPATRNLLKAPKDLACTALISTCPIQRLPCLRPRGRISPA